ncbi:MAG: nascent polypeptide-associated complex protein [Candidatus Methanomethylicia archaeon]|nr:nascent polypeptide-associated complex protein [Candidatus Methanomethylicia archaeon]MCX8169093.1 nascent polypeptide-associated complex protein [Candidatus Methanomethylicia archaeon]MDW7988825.1 nascent polypeptide-associated complex protein [Nitrososphaerota archaeon]
MRKMSSRELKRFMQKMGMNVDEIGDVEEIIIIRKQKIMKIPSPNVSMIRIGDQTIIQVIAEKILTEERRETVKQIEIEIPEEDIQLVAAQAGVSLEEARKALKQADGDLAKAILILTTIKTNK